MLEEVLYWWIYPIMSLVGEKVTKIIFIEDALGLEKFDKSQAETKEQVISI